MDSGWIKLHRKLLEKGYYRNSQYVHLWVHLLLLANHKPHEYMHDGKILILKEGQLITGRKALSEATGISQTTIERILDLFESEHQIGQQKTSKYRVITVLNWKDHQERTGERTSGGHLADTYKNVRMKEDVSEAELRVESFTPGKEEEPRARPKAKYPHAKEVFGWFPRPEKSWNIDTTQLKHAELLYERGEERVKKALAFVKKHKDDEYFPKITKPSDLERKWNDLAAYKV